MFDTLAAEGRVNAISRTLARFLARSESYSSLQNIRKMEGLSYVGAVAIVADFSSFSSALVALSEHWATVGSKTIVVVIPEDCANEVCLCPTGQE